MAEVSLDISRIRGQVSAKDLVAYWNELRADGSSDAAICQALLDAVEQELVSPGVFDIFVPWSKSPAVVSKCLKYESDAKIRSCGMKGLGRHLKRPGKFNWELTWQALEGTDGLVQIFSKSSVAEVKTLSIFIGSCNRGRKVEERERCIEELLRALLPGVYTSSSGLQSKDRRPVHHHYAKMLSACSPNFVNDVLNSRDSSNPLFRWRDLTKLIRTHRTLLRERAINHLFGSGPEDKDVPQYLDIFLYSDRDFATKALQGRLEGTVTDKRWGGTAEISVLMPIVHRLSKNWKAPVEVKRHIHDLIKLGLEILGKSSDKRKDGSKSLWDVTFSRWQIWPDQYEDNLRLGLRLGLAKLPHRDPGSYLNVLRRLRPGPRERLLQLCYLEIPEQALDIFSANDYSTVAKQTWPVELFYLMSTEQAIRLLKKLYAVNPDYDFLQTPGGTSLLPGRNVGPGNNFNVELYLTMLQRSDKKVQQDAREAIDRLRRKAVVAREQTSRANFAKAAASYAIATGDLDVYSETIVWQQRFVRDPLTVKTIFSRNAVHTEEGIELLSGIPTPETLASTCRDNIPLLLNEISRGIETADAVLRTLQESYLLAKREPSFQEYDWTHVKGLFSAVFSSRVTRSQAVWRDFPVSRSEVSHVIWKALLAAFEWMEADFIQSLRGPVQELLQGSQPGFLAAATKSLLDVGTERRRKRKAQETSQKGSTESVSSSKPSEAQPPGFPGAAKIPPGFPGAVKKSSSEDESLEQMSYHALMELASSDRPALASPLILQTILERPDASSWHRMLLSIGFLKKLRAEEAHELLLELAKGIGEKLEEQSYVRVGETELPKHAPSQPAVKVTTVKYLAQLLNKAEFISNDAAVEVLIELFKAAQHRDIRLAALDSLLNLLDSICTGTQEEVQADPTVRNIMTALKTIVPIAGSINERRPLTAEDWKEAEGTGVLPDLSDVVPGTLPPLMEAVVCAAGGGGRPGLKKLETEFIEHLVIPVLEQSQQEHTRWLNMFLAKHKATALKNDLPEMPIAPRLWRIVLNNHYPSIPIKHLTAFHRYAVHCIAPAPALKQFTASLMADPEYRKDPEVIRWLITAHDTKNFRMSETNTLLELLDRQQQLTERGVLLDMISQHASLYLDEYEKYASVWEEFVGNLSPRSNSMWSEVSYKIWDNNGRAISSRCIDLVRHKKQQGQRLILPSTTEMELWLLFTVDWCREDNNCRDFVFKLEECLLTMLRESDTGALCWHEIARVASEVISAMVTTDKERLMVANHMGEFGGAGGASDGTRQLALDLIKLEVVLKLISQCQAKKIGDALTSRLEEWLFSGRDRNVGLEML
ncbi:hypothetical protein J7T55_014220 [Diaporthe amygdali]|uniref:uncharacterized protein n=1 Tax=Phomopsis amygdali TaxID=1214568 RepID=UPI0022FE284B|nr:uncharacterized protein J7T55_014220 [Diaporthe amygdali]KAJ0109658.1 hypothetical protein J7T55_014220 [Diaporthe amygdali]